MHILIKYIMILTTLLFLSVSSKLFAQDIPGAIENQKSYYSVLIRNTPIDQYEENIRIYEDLREKGYLVYYNWYVTPLQYFVKVGVGRFDNIQETEKFGNLFNEYTGINFTIDSLQLTARNRKYYTALLRTFSSSDSREARSFEREISNMGFSANSFMSGPRAKTNFKLHAGVFRNTDEAEQFTELLREREGLDSSVDSAAVKVSEIDDESFIVTTPSAIWSKTGDSSVEIYTFDKNKSSSIYRRNVIYFDDTKVRLSPDKKSIVFLYDYKIIKVNLADKNETILLEHVPDNQNALLNSFPQWSPSGDFIAFMDFREWEVICSLWTMKPDGTDLKRIVTGDSKNSVKNFLWHPTKDEIFFIAGSAYGTVSIGGKIYSVDIEGNQKEILSAEAVDGFDIQLDFRITGDKIIYRVSHYEGENFINRYFTTHEYIIPDIIK